MSKQSAVVIPGEKLCPSCRTFDLSKCNQECNEAPTADIPIASCSYIEASELNETQASLNATLQELDISPLKIHAVLMGKMKTKTSRMCCIQENSKSIIS